MLICLCIAYICLCIIVAQLSSYDRDPKAHTKHKLFTVWILTGNKKKRDLTTGLTQLKFVFCSQKKVLGNHKFPWVSLFHVII